MLFLLAGRADVRHSVRSHHLQDLDRGGTGDQFNPLGPLQRQGHRHGHRRHYQFGCHHHPGRSIRLHRKVVNSDR